MFEVTSDVLINGQKLAAGSYSLHTIPNKDEWTIVFNGTANQWGSFNYDPAKDTLRVKAKPQMVAESQEWLALTVDFLARTLHRSTFVGRRSACRSRLKFRTYLRQLWPE